MKQPNEISFLIYKRQSALSANSMSEATAMSASGSDSGPGPSTKVDGVVRGGAQQVRGRSGQKIWKGGGGGRPFKRRAYTGDNSSWGKRRRQSGGGGTSEMPFLHGGNIKDPLNLESVKPVDDEENMKLLEIIIPKNIHDPLNLRSITRNRNKRKRRNSKQYGEGGESPHGEESEQISRRSNTFSGGEAFYRPKEAIVSPVPKSVIRKFSSPAKTGQQRPQNQVKLEKPSKSVIEVSDVQSTSDATVTKNIKGATAAVVLPQTSDESSNPVRPETSTEKKAERKAKNNERFRYGNFNRYYGSRLEHGTGKDPRLEVFKKEWFEKKSVLDIGCNAGYVTLSIAKEFEPRRCVGIDIDDHLVGVARKNIRHYCDRATQICGSFPASFGHRYGPISVPSLTFSTKFPDNVWFRQENYVLEKDEYLDSVKEEFDVILALSITKWIHLNWGDSGLKRFFKRAFLHLRPGGLFILEPQSFESYKKRAKQTPETREMFRTLRFMPRHFQEFLIAEVGFESCDHIEAPKAKTKGFERPIQVYHKKAPKFLKMEKCESNEEANTKSREPVNEESSGAGSKEQAEHEIEEEHSVENGGDKKTSNCFNQMNENSKEISSPKADCH